MFKWITSFFWTDKQDNLSLEDAYAILDDQTTDHKEITETSEENENSSNSFSYCYKTGYITKVERNIYMIDDMYEYTTDLANLFLGTKVSFAVHVDKGKAIVSNLSITDDWSSNNKEEKSTWLNRTLQAKVIKRDGRKIITSLNTVIDLDTLAVEFIPIVGDWLSLDVKCTVDEKSTDLSGQILQVNKVYPTLSNIINGKVKKWVEEDEYGIINGNIYFDKSAMPMGYVPFTGDLVTAEVIESDQKLCTWRAVKILPDKKHATLRNIQENSVVDALSVQYICSHPDVYITDNIEFTCKSFDDCVNGEFTIGNNSETSLILQNIHFKCSNCYVRIVNPENVKNVQIRAKEILKINLTCKPKGIGKTKEVILFQFTNFTIGRNIVVTLKMNNSKLKHSHYNVSKHEINNWKSNSVIPGEKTFVSNRFIANRTPEYPVPKKLREIYQQYYWEKNHILEEQLIKAKPTLQKNLSYQIYEDYFHTLLFIEELHQEIEIAKYNLQRACFVKNGEYLMLEIENLSEQRPSLIVGDKILAKDPGKEDADVYEGHIHKLGANHLYLKFNHGFHDIYNGEDYSIKAVLSRSMFRKMHRGISLVLRSLGRDLLFPSKVIHQDPQLEFDYEPYEDILPHTGIL